MKFVLLLPHRSRSVVLLNWCQHWCTLFPLIFYSLSWLYYVRTTSNIYFFRYFLWYFSFIYFRLFVFFCFSKILQFNAQFIQFQRRDANYGKLRDLLCAIIYKLLYHTFHELFAINNMNNWWTKRWNNAQIYERKEEKKRNKQKKQKNEDKNLHTNVK